MLIVPPIAYWVTYRICLGLQRSDRAVLEHGVETGIIKRLPHGEFIEVHQPLGRVDAPRPPDPAGVPGRPGAQADEPAGSAGAPVAGSLLKPDPADGDRRAGACTGPSRAGEGGGDANDAAAKERERGALAGRPSDLED